MWMGTTNATGNFSLGPGSVSAREIVPLKKTESFKQILATVVMKMSFFWGLPTLPEAPRVPLKFQSLLSSQFRRVLRFAEYLRRGFVSPFCRSFNRHALFLPPTAARP
jgi:hypothetical protein